MTFVVGDIHGEISKLRQLLTFLSRYPITKIVFVGDYIDKGENSKACLQFLMRLSRTHPCVFLLGDHEYAWKRFVTEGDYREFILQYGGRTTMRDFGISELSPPTVISRFYKPFQNFFTKLQKFIVDGRYIISHSGVNPRLVASKTLEDLDEKEFVFQRFNVIMSTQRVRNRRLIFGHTAFTRPYFDGWKIGVDTGAVYSPVAPLTAFSIEQEFFVTHDGRVRPLSDLDPNSCPILQQKGSNAEW